MKLRLPIILFLLSIGIGGVVLYEPWIIVVGQVKPATWNVIFVEPWAIIIGDRSAPTEPEHITSLRFWEDEPISLYYSPCPFYTYQETPVVAHIYETFLNGGRVIFGAIILC